LPGGSTSFKTYLVIFLAHHEKLFYVEFSKLENSRNLAGLIFNNKISPKKES
jgi:hypothetical protein